LQYWHVFQDAIHVDLAYHLPVPTLFINFNVFSYIFAV